MNKRKEKDINSVYLNPSTPPSSDEIPSSQDKNASDNNSSNDATSKKKNKKRKRQKDTSSQGRWTDDEHALFVEGKQLSGVNNRYLR